MSDGEEWVGHANARLAFSSLTSRLVAIRRRRDDAIKRPHTEYIAATIPHAPAPDPAEAVSPSCRPDQFNFTILHFLGDE
jgi:hypothetical protein